MENLVPPIRNAVRAVIVRDGCVLLLRKSGGERAERYALPGGAQDVGETLEQALIRECLEEIGTTVSVGALLHIGDYFKARDTDPPSTRHLVEFAFRCTVPDDYVARNGSKPDKSQIDVVWAELADLTAMPLFPKSLSSHVEAGLKGGAAGYLGTIE